MGKDYKYGDYKIIIYNMFIKIKIFENMSSGKE